MLILAVESSCDETAVALVRDGRTVLADCIASSVEMHKLYGGVVPEIASRKHIEVISQLADQALAQAGVTRGTLTPWPSPMPPASSAPCWWGSASPSPWPMRPGRAADPGPPCAGGTLPPITSPTRPGAPFVCLCVSGGTSLIVDVKGYTDMAILGGTRDDAAGECFDKIARVMGLGYPGGGPWTELPREGMTGPFPLPRVHIEDAPLDMSFSGLKTAMLNLIHKAQQKGETLPVADLAASFSAAVSEELVPGPWPPPGRRATARWRWWGRGRQLPDPPGSGGRLPAGRLHPCTCPPEALRGQWQHDWQPGLLRVPGRHPRGGPQRLRQPGHLFALREGRGVKEFSHVPPACGKPGGKCA